MSLLLIFTTLLWNYPPCHQLFEKFIILKDPISCQKQYLEFQIHGAPTQQSQQSRLITYPPPGHHVASLLR